MRYKCVYIIHEHATQLWTTQAQAELQEREKDYINFMSARKLHKRPKYMSARKLHERPKLHERKNITKTTRVQTNLHVIQEFIKNRYLIRARTSNRRMHYLTKKSTLWQCPVRWPIIQKDSLFCTSALTVRLGLTCRGDVTWRPATWLTSGDVTCELDWTCWLDGYRLLWRTFVYAFINGKLKQFS